MAEPNWLAESEMVIGSQHPLYANTKDRCGNTIQSMIEVEHGEGGVHTARATGLSGEINTFAGNGAARTISLSNSGLTPKKIYVWEGASAELCSNPGFDSDTTGWTAAVCAIASVGGGISGNCCQTTWTGVGGNEYVTYAASGLTVGALYRFSYWFKEGTNGKTFGTMYGDSLPGSGTSGGTTTASWQQVSHTFTATATTMYFGWYNSDFANGETLLVDDVSLTREGHDPTRIDLMTSDKAQPFRYQNEAWEADLIDNETAGSFDVGDTGINTNGVTNYYLVLGVDTDTVPTGDTGAGSDPTWITSNVLNRIIADNTDTQDSGNIANYVESEIWEQFTEEHTVAGAHSITLQHERIETISWAGNDSSPRDITCVITDLDITYIEIWKDGNPCVFKSTDMSSDNTKSEAVAAFLTTDYINDITTNGEFTVGSFFNASGSTYVAFIIGV